MELPRCEERAGESRQLGAGDALRERRAAEWIRSQHLSNDAGQRRRSQRHRIRRKRQLEARLGRRSYSRRRPHGHHLKGNPEVLNGRLDMRSFLVAVFLAGLSVIAEAQGTTDWTQWRGPTRDGDIGSFTPP